MSTISFLLLALVALCLVGFLFVAGSVGVVAMKVTLAVVGILAVIFLIIDRDGFARR